MIPGAVLGLMVIAVIGIVAGFTGDDDDEDLDLDEYDDWELLR